MSKWARIENNAVMEVTGIDPAGRFHKSLVWLACSDDVQPGWMHEGDQFIPPPEPPAPTLEEKQAMITSAVQAHLDTFAHTRGYDNILSAASYVSSINPKFAAEGQCAVEVRDLTWDKCWQIFTEFMSGQRPEPTLDEIMAELPVLEWPEV